MQKLSGVEVLKPANGGIMESEGLYLNDPISAFLADTSFCVPIGQVIFLIALISMCLLTRKFKLGLLLTYSFVFYWGFIFNHNYFINMLGKTSAAFYAYALLGLSMLAMSFLGFRDEEKITHVVKGKRKGERRKIYIKIPEEIKARAKRENG